MDSSKKHPSDYSHEEWESRRSQVDRLYMKDKRPLREVMQILAADGFDAT